eukprot:TRINITY_DN28032_c0_g1_i1.p1 TRINITY_DN28032_c0_g1~~TRINITY_DN28032_c0_g1_i1.p1  ORF type:complete len:329 (+),score=90.51 TRINITY_DN28032_c0_g1_i1:113-1099(+)
MAATQELPDVFADIPAMTAYMKRRAGEIRQKSDEGFSEERRLDHELWQTTTSWGSWSPSRSDCSDEEMCAEQFRRSRELFNELKRVSPKTAQGVDISQLEELQSEVESTVASPGATGDAFHPSKAQVENGARVVVVEDFLSNDSSKEPLSLGTEGIVRTVSERGSVCVRFEGVSLALWVSARNVHKLRVDPEPPVLPDAWAQASDPDGRVYYYNRTTKQTQWTWPLDALDLLGVAEEESEAEALLLAQREFAQKLIREGADDYPITEKLRELRHKVHTGRRHDGNMLQELHVATFGRPTSTNWDTKPNRRRRGSIASASSNDGKQVKE